MDTRSRRLRSGIDIVKHSGRNSGYTKNLSERRFKSGPEFGDNKCMGKTGDRRISHETFKATNLLIHLELLLMEMTIRGEITQKDIAVKLIKYMKRQIEVFVSKYKDNPLIPYILFNYIIDLMISVGYRSVRRYKFANLITDDLSPGNHKVKHDGLKSKNSRCFVQLRIFVDKIHEISINDKIDYLLTGDVINTYRLR